MDGKKIIKNFSGTFQGMNINFGDGCTMNNVQIGCNMTMNNGTFIQGQTVLVKCKYCGGQKDKSKICPGCGAR